MRFRKSGHSIYRIEYHVVWTYRYRRRIFVKGVKEYVTKLLHHLDNLDEDIEVRKVNVQHDHVQLVMVIPPRLSGSGVVQFFKSRSSKKLKAPCPFMNQAIAKVGIWSRGYCVSAIGLNQRAILRYVEYQGQDDQGQLELDFGS